MDTNPDAPVARAAQELRSTKERSLVAAAEGLRQFLSNAKARVQYFSTLASALQFPASEQDFCEGGDCSPAALNAAAKAVGSPHAAKELAAPPALDDVRVEFTRLFVLPGPVSLYGAAYQPGAANERVTVARIYRAAGLTPALSSNEPADFLPFEFDYLNYLAQAEVQALHAQDFLTARDLRTAGEAFWDDHLATPAARLGEALSARATLPFYRAVAALLKAATAPGALFGPRE